MDTLKRRITLWAATRPEIRAILVVGSRARTHPPADEWADLDLHLFCTDPDALLADPGWLESIGEVWTWLPERIDGEIPQLLVLFDGGLKVDFAFLPLSVLKDFVASRRLDEIHARGYTVFLDKDGWAGRMPAPQGRSPRREPPSEAAFLRVVNAFLYGAVYVAKQIRRRNLWVVKYRDWTMKTQLLQMMEWHAHALHGPEHDTFHDGHRLSQWTDTQTWDDLHHAFGGFGAAASWQVLFETIELFRRLATRAALLWGYGYPAGLDKKIAAYVQSLYED